MLTVCCCIFKRDKTSRYEEGVIINEDQLILDSQGKVVPAPLWTYILQPHSGCVVFNRVPNPAQK